MSPNSPYGRPAALINAANKAAQDAQPLTTLCAFCPWTYHGTVLEGRQHAAQHRTLEHPDAKQTRRRRHSLNRFTAREDSWRDEGLLRGAEVAAMHRRREEAA